MDTIWIVQGLCFFFTDTVWILFGTQKNEKWIVRPHGQAICTQSLTFLNKYRNWNYCIFVYYRFVLQELDGSYAFKSTYSLRKLSDTTILFTKISFIYQGFFYLPTPTSVFTLIPLIESSFLGDIFRFQKRVANTRTFHRKFVVTNLYSESDFRCQSKRIREQQYQRVLGSSLMKVKAVAKAC